MKKGFTLVELIAVIVIISLLSLLAIPPIMNQLSSSKERVSKETDELIFTAVYMYVNNNSNYPKNSGAEYCVQLSTLVNEGLLESPVHDFVNDIDLELDKYVKIKVNKYNDYELVNSYVDNCEG